MPADVSVLTPAMRQYVEQKRQVGDAILLFRMGDFYELFYEDAKVAAKLLGITLTSRDTGRTPLAGIPYHALNDYLKKLVAAGKKVAISEQIEEAAQAKTVIQRAIVRVVTPGTLTEDSLLEQTRANTLAAIWRESDDLAGVASLELSTGEFSVQLCAGRGVIDELIRVAPAEVLLPESRGVGRDPLDLEIGERVGAAVTYRTAADFQPQRAEQVLLRQFETRTLAGFGFERVDASLQAAGALVAYALETQRGAVTHIRPPRRRPLEQFVVLDAVTLRSLEVERTLRSAGRDGSLLGAVDWTVSPMGARLLRAWLCYPLHDAAAIERRLDAVESLRLESRRRSELREALRGVGDLERIIGRLGVFRITPRDLRLLGNGLGALPAIRASLSGVPCAIADELLGMLDGLDELGGRICAMLRPDAPTTVKEGAIFLDGVSAELDRLRSLNADGERWLGEYQAAEQQRTGIPSLKIAFNSVFGFYIEVTHAHRERVPADYVRRQTVKNAERYVTDALKKHEQEVLTAETRAHELEHQMFLQLRDETARAIPRMQAACAALAQLDVLAGWAELSLKRGYCRPEFCESPTLEIDAGRHPVVEQVLGDQFVPNDTALDASGKSLALITGPNMAGKSTYIRQVATLALLAHCGCFVPAKRMRLGLVDRIFTRVGASDELARGQSTFMVEMTETANILHNATRRSLVILDEIGRGTSTFDGLALAWAISEYLATRAGCRALFATHFHELTELAELLEPVFNLNVAVKEYEDTVVFLHRIIAGAADRSYGLHVGKLAGLPRDVLDRANSVLNELERTFGRESQRPVLAAVQRRRKKQLRLFEEPEEQIVRELREMSREANGEAAAELVRRWRELLGVRRDEAK